MQWFSDNWPWMLFVAGIFLLMRQGGLGCGMAPHGRHHHRAGGQDDATQEAVDPVSGERVRTGDAPNTMYAGDIYYFASRANRDTFEANPARYIRDHRGHGCC